MLFALLHVHALGLGLVLKLLGVVVGLALYFLPTIIAMTRHTTKVLLVALVNLLLGWSLIGWVAALVMAVTFKPKPRY